MPAPAMGHVSHLQFGKETTWGTPVAATNNIPILSDTIELDAPPIPDTVLHGNPWERTKYQGPRRVMGDFSTQLLFEGMTELLRGVFGGYAATTVETGVRDHTFKIGSTLNKYTLEEIIDRSPGSSCFTAFGVKFDKFVLRGTQGQGPDSLLTAAFTCIGKDRTDSGTPTGSLTLPTPMPVKFDLQTVVDDGTADSAANVRVRSFEFTLENALADDRFYAGSLFIDEPFRAGPIKASFRFTQEFQTFTQYVAYRNLTLGSPRLLFQHPTTIGTTSKREFEIRANQAYLEKVSTPVDGPGTVIATSTWLATFDGVDGTEASPVVARLRNTETALP